MANDQIDALTNDLLTLSLSSDPSFGKRSGLSNQTRLVVFRFLTVADFGACLSVNKSWHAGDCHAAWWSLYMTTQQPDSLDQLDDELRRQIERPFGEDAIGWRVAVLQFVDDADESERHENGQIHGYDRDRDRFHVVYDKEVNGRRSVWIQDWLPQEQRLAMRQKTRFTFICPPGSWIGGGSPSKTAIELPTMRLSNWREEVKHNVQNVPLRMLQRLPHHGDEVLFVAFSPCGSRLASCSRDKHTRVFRIKSSTAAPHTEFELEAVLEHRSAAMWAMWWPEGSCMSVIIAMEHSPSVHRSRTAGDLEIWKNVVTHGGGSGPSSTFSRIGHWENDPYDLFAACITWPRGPSTVSKVCFTVGRRLTLVENSYEQLVEVWPGPCACEDYEDVQPLAILRLQHIYNPVHCLAASRHDNGRNILAMTGSMPEMQDQLCLFNFNEISQIHQEVESSRNVPTYDVPLTIRQMDERVVLSAKWGQSGDVILVNTRPYVSGTYVSPFRDEQPKPSIHLLIERPLPFDLSTSVELMLLDASTLACVGIYGGHSAFTDKNNPFLLHTDDSIGSDFLASGGEDGYVYIWHRHHRLMLRKLMGHRDAVNAVSWNGQGILASASDDFTVAIWAVASIFRQS